MRRLASIAIAIVVVLSTAPMTPVAAASTFVRHVILTSRFSAPSPDPTGLDLKNGQLLVADSEVDETGLDKGRNIWLTSRRGVVKRSMSTYRFSHEPTDIAADTSRNVWYFSDDTPYNLVNGRGSINVTVLGPDRIYGTRDDKRRSFATGPCGSHDPEGLAFGGGSLWVSDATTGIVFRLDPGPNLKIEGCGPDSDDVRKDLNLSGLGVTDLEGLEFANNRLFVVANEKNADILEIDPTDGSLIKAFDLSTAGISHPSALAYGPSSLNPSKKSFYVADRGRDNNAQPNENDGRIIELGVAKRPLNLVRNGGFERDRNGNHRPDFWTVNPAFTRTSLARHDGTYSGRHRSAADVSYTIRQDLNDVVAGETYHFEGWTKIPATSDAFFYRIRIVWFGSNGAKISTSGIDAFTAQTVTWAHTAENVTAPAGTVRGKMVMSVSGLSGTIYADSFSLTVVT